MHACIRSLATLAGLAAVLLLAAPSSAQISGYLRRSAVDGPGLAELRWLDVECPAGMQALAGGAQIEGSRLGTSVFWSSPIYLHPEWGWRGGAYRNPTALARSWSLRVDVICGFVAGYEQVSAFSGLGAGSPKAFELECPPPKQLLGGGARNYDASTLALSYAFPLSPDRWAVYVWEQSTPEYGEWHLGADAICGTVGSSREVVQGWSEHTLGSFAEHEVSCPLGKRVIGGGVVGVPGKTVLTAHGPIGNRWRGAARYVGDPLVPWQVGVTAVCPEPDGIAAALASFAGLGTVARRRRPAAAGRGAHPR